MLCIYFIYKTFTYSFNCNLKTFPVIAECFLAYYCGFLILVPFPILSHLKSSQVFLLLLFVFLFLFFNAKSCSEMSRIILVQLFVQCL